MKVQDEVVLFYKPETLKKIGQILIRKIQDRTAQGMDFEGKEFKDYSRRTFALPAGAVTKRARKLLAKNGLLAWTNRSGKKWIVVKGGYWNLKMATYAQTSYYGTVNLTATGEMMRSLRVTETGENEITIGFKDAENAAKAYYNKLMGREFLGVLPQDWDDPEIDALLLDGSIIVR